MGWRGVLCEQANGASVLAELHSQRQTLQRTRDTLAGIDAALDKGDSTLKKMKRWWFF